MRRPMRHRLGTAMILVAVAAVPLALGSRALRHRSARERAIAAVLARRPDRRPHGLCGPRQLSTPALRLPVPDLTADDLAPLAMLTDLELVDLSNSGLGDDGLRHLAALPRLRTLFLDDTRVTGAGLRHLSGLMTLVAPKLPRSITDAGLIHLGPWKGLPSLDRSGTGISGPGLPLLKRLPAPKSLDLSATDVDDSGLSYLNTEWGLESLSLAGCAVGDDGLFHLGGLYAMRALDLGGTHVQGRGLTALEFLPDPARLTLRGASLDRSAFAPLEAMAGLKEVDLASHPRLAPYLDALSRARPDRTITRW